MQDEEFLEDFLKEVRGHQPKLPPPFLLEMIAYEEWVFPNSNGDRNAAFRLSVLYALHKAFSLDDRAFIRYLLEQEIIYHQRLRAFSHSIHLFRTTKGIFQAQWSFDASSRSLLLCKSGVFPRTTACPSQQP